MLLRGDRNNLPDIYTHTPLALEQPLPHVLGLLRGTGQPRCVPIRGYKNNRITFPIAASASTLPQSNPLFTLGLLQYFFGHLLGPLRLNSARTPSTLVLALCRAVLATSCTFPMLGEASSSTLTLHQRQGSR